MLPKCQHFHFFPRDFWVKKRYPQAPFEFFFFKQLAAHLVSLINKNLFLPQPGVWNQGVSCVGLPLKASCNSLSGSYMSLTLIGLLWACIFWVYAYILTGLSGLCLPPSSQPCYDPSCSLRTLLSKFWVFSQIKIILKICFARWYWHTPFIPALRRQRQADLCESEVSLVYKNKVQDSQSCSIQKPCF